MGVDRGCLPWGWLPALGMHEYGNENETSCTKIVKRVTRLAGTSDSCQRGDEAAKEGQDAVQKEDYYEIESLKNQGGWTDPRGKRGRPKGFKDIN